MSNILKNPILPGFYPDPSVCRKGSDYYLVTSTFEYFPGIPLFHSKDFVNWHQIGNVLSRPEQLDLDGIASSKGIYASSIFYHDEKQRFYVISTLVKNNLYHDNVNFYVWSENPEGPWSQPVVIKGAEGIDPSLVFDGEKAYYLGNLRPFPREPEKGRYIWLQELNLERGELIGERSILLKQGAFMNAAAPEGPHIYHIGDWYYLMIAEGGTFRNHACTMFRSKKLTGPYEADPRNPLITHRNLRSDYPIKNPGHSDLVQLHNGEWWAVLLATRQDGGDYGNLGRETFAVPVEWEEEWPLFSPGTGHVEFCYPAPDLPEQKWRTELERENFDCIELPYKWLMLRTPRSAIYSLTDRSGFLRLYLHSNTIKQESFCSFIGCRQQHLCFKAAAAMEFDPVRVGEAAGMVLLMNHKYHIRIEYGNFDSKKELRLTRCFDGQDQILFSLPWNKNKITFHIQMNYQSINFSCSGDGKKQEVLLNQVDGSLLNRETAGGYTGTVIGLYASSNHTESSNFADFDWFDYYTE